MLRCTKMNGNGNDFIVVDNMALQFNTQELTRFAQQLCRRRLSVGADGLLITEPSQVADFKMRLFNSDGSEGEMCGNGARCIARFAYEKGIVSSTSMCFETLGGEVRASVDGHTAALELSPVSLYQAVHSTLTADGCEYEYIFLTVGVPHVVIFEKKRSREFSAYASLGREIRNRFDLFPQGANVNFTVVTDNGLDVMTYERGVEDMTLSCGTGSTAAAIAAMLLGLRGTETRVANPGGVNVVKLSLSNDGRTAFPQLVGAMLMTAELEILPEGLI